MNSQINNKHRAQTSIHIKDFNVWIKGAHILKNIDLNIAEQKITCIIGPSGGGEWYFKNPACFQSPLARMFCLAFSN